jgi:hypothetical protein
MHYGFRIVSDLGEFLFGFQVLRGVTIHPPVADKPPKARTNSGIVGFSCRGRYLILVDTVTEMLSEPATILLIDLVEGLPSALLEKFDEALEDGPGIVGGVPRVDRVQSCGDGRMER